VNSPEWRGRRRYAPAVLDGDASAISDGDEDQDKKRMGEGSSGAWSAGSIASCDGAEARLEVERAAGASGVRWPRGFAAEQSERRH
jgi:hypothetical protein